MGKLGLIAGRRDCPPLEIAQSLRKAGRSAVRHSPEAASPTRAPPTIAGDEVGLAEVGKVLKSPARAPAATRFALAGTVDPPDFRQAEGRPARPDGRCPASSPPRQGRRRPAARAGRRVRTGRLRRRGGPRGGWAA